MKIAVLGTGLMGAPIAANLAAAGHTVRVWNRTRAKAEPLAAQGATVTDSPAEAVEGTEIVLTVLNDGATVTAVMQDAAPSLSHDVVWIQASTVGVASTEDHIDLARSLGLEFVDAPVLGSTKPAAEGKLVVLASGADELRERVQPVFDVIGARTMWVGEAGASSKLKLVANSWVLALTAAVGEAVSLAEASGIDPKLFLEAVSGGAVDCAYLQTKGNAIIERSFPPAFTVQNALKDALLVNEAAVRANVRLDVAQASSARLNRAVTKGHGGEDMAASYYASHE
ncbi:3-hydroxyisobutyrate dehydrogenase [Lentzea albidocapillata subsp. violacea]|uniref:3-hydroxyisobutyrate dehydrogenase n=1 Tax=Lentzea albidocapillata subsp. violacea TaxID=128104 RepID=A0A1G9CSV7_9PSEU|nr:NAD(P)-dependent oxidoreductase [Lentzea albidocapillata]SDK54709.1 3-hydroxyisobutyrate dehydrogenase [Lentzea albidocapillata subsp. violacea]